MKSNEKQYGFNIKILQSLNRITKKMDKEIESRKSRSHISHDKRREYRTVYRNHHHSARHSIKREKSSPSLSLSGIIREGLQWMRCKNK
jgi:hypothetical protein